MYTKTGALTQRTQLAKARLALAAQATQAVANSHWQQLPPDWHQLTAHQQNIWLYAVETYRSRWEASH